MFTWGFSANTRGFQSGRCDTRSGTPGIKRISQRKTASATSPFAPEGSMGSVETSRACPARWAPWRLRSTRPGEAARALAPSGQAAVDTDAAGSPRRHYPRPSRHIGTVGEQSSWLSSEAAATPCPLAMAAVSPAVTTPARSHVSDVIGSDRSLRCRPVRVRTARLPLAIVEIPRVLPRRCRLRPGCAFVQFPNLKGRCAKLPSDRIVRSK